MNQRPLFLAVTLVALLVISGAFWMMQEHQVAVNQPVVADSIVETPVQTEPETQVNTSDWKPQLEVAKTFEPVTGEDGWVWFPVPELGIGVKVKKDIAPELIYQVKEFQSSEDNSDGKYAQFTTKKLMGIGEKNGLGTYTDQCNIGTFVLYNGVNPADLKMSKKSGSYVDEKEGVAVIFRSPQSFCSNKNEADMNYEEYLILNWLKRVDGIQEPLTGSVRKIK